MKKWFQDLYLPVVVCLALIVVLVVVGIIGAVLGQLVVVSSSIAGAAITLAILSLREV